MGTLYYGDNLDILRRYLKDETVDLVYLDPPFEQAAIGILISLQPPTAPMETEAASIGFYEHKTNKQKYPRLQLRTVKELMEGKGIERPTSAASLDDTFKKAPQSKKKHSEQTELGV